MAHIWPLGQTCATGAFFAFKNLLNVKQYKERRAKNLKGMDTQRNEPKSNHTETDSKNVTTTVDKSDSEIDLHKDDHNKRSQDSLSPSILEPKQKQRRCTSNSTSNASQMFNNDLGILWALSTSYLKNAEAAQTRSICTRSRNAIDSMGTHDLILRVSALDLMNQYINDRSVKGTLQIVIDENSNNDKLYDNLAKIHQTFTQNPDRYQPTHFILSCSSQIWYWLQTKQVTSTKEFAPTKEGWKVIADFFQMNSLKQLTVDLPCELFPQEEETKQHFLDCIGKCQASCYRTLITCKTLPLWVNKFIHTLQTKDKTIPRLEVADDEFLYQGGVDTKNQITNLILDLETWGISLRSREEGIIKTENENRFQYWLNRLTITRDENPSSVTIRFRERNYSPFDLDIFSPMEINELLEVKIDSMFSGDATEWERKLNSLHSMPPNVTKLRFEFLGPIIPSIYSYPKIEILCKYLKENVSIIWRPKKCFEYDAQECKHVLYTNEDQHLIQFLKTGTVLRIIMPTGTHMRWQIESFFEKAVMPLFFRTGTFRFAIGLSKMYIKQFKIKNENSYSGDATDWQTESVKNMRSILIDLFVAKNKHFFWDLTISETITEEPLGKDGCHFEEDTEADRNEIPFTSFTRHAYYYPVGWIECIASWKDKIDE